MTTSRLRPGSWWLASALGLALGIPAGLALGAPLEVVVGMVLVTPIMLGMVGAIVGTSQWLVLRRQLARAGWWVAVTAVGLSAGLTTAVVVIEKGGALLTGGPVRLATTGLGGLAAAVALLGILGGIALGIAQWLYLRRRTRATAGWIWSNTLALTAGLLLGLGLASLVFGDVRSLAGAAAFLVSSGLVFGLITARALPRAVAP